MRILRLAIAIAFLRGTVIVAGIIAGPDPAEGYCRDGNTSKVYVSRIHHAERILLASLTALAVYFVWTSIGRAWS